MQRYPRVGVDFVHTGGRMCVAIGFKPACQHFGHADGNKMAATIMKCQT